MIQENKCRARQAIDTGTVRAYYPGTSGGICQGLRASYDRRGASF